MKQMIPAVLLAGAFAVITAHAQDSTVTKKTQVEADDARAVVMSGCLTQGPAGTFMLTGATATSGEDLTTRSRVETDVDKDDTEVKVQTRTEVDRDTDRPVGTSSRVTSFEVTPRAGVNLAAHVGHRVEISAVMIDAGRGDAEVEIREKGEVDNDDAPDAETKTRTEVEVDRGTANRLMALSITHVSPTCN